MTNRYTHFIRENIAPKGARRIGLYNADGERVVGISLGSLKPPKKDKLYSIGLISDIHLASYKPTAQTRLDKILAFFKGCGAEFCCHCGDMCDYGFWYPKSENPPQSYYEPQQFAVLKNLAQKHDIAVYGNCGNHECYNGYDMDKTYTDIYGTDPTLVVNNLEKLQEYTGHGLVFTIAKGNDVYIFVGQSTGNRPMTNAHLQWLYERLEENRNKRCFVFIHPFLSYEDSGATSQNGLALFDLWGAKNKEAFISMMVHYKNTILFHGHSHINFSVQEHIYHGIYSTELGFRSVHVPSTYSNSKIVNGTLTEVDTGVSLGYFVDVYDDCIVLNGMDFINEKPVPIGTYKIDTTLKTISANTFTDSTGTIKT